MFIQANSVLKDGKMSQLLDPDISGDCNNEQIERMVLAATLCIRRDPRTRPRMGNVSHELSLFPLLFLLFLSWNCPFTCLQKLTLCYDSQILKLLQGDAEVTSWAKQQINSYPVDFDALDGETSPVDIQSHLNVALLDIVEDDSVSVCSTEQNISLEDYLKGRWSRSSSFD